MVIGADEKEKVDELLGHLEDARDLIKSSKKKVLSLIEEACSFYAAARKPILKLDDEIDERQAARLFDLIHNVKMDSADAVEILKMDSNGLSVLVNVLGPLMSSPTLMSVLQMFMGGMASGGGVAYGMDGSIFTPEDVSDPDDGAAS